MRAFLTLATTLLIGSAGSFTPPTTVASPRSRTIVFMSDVPQDKVNNNKKGTSKRAPSTNTKDREEPRALNLKSRDIRKNWRDEWFPEPPEDVLTLAGDVASLYLYSFLDHFLNGVFLSSLLESSSSAADAAHTLDPSGQDIMLPSTPVWLDPTALGPHISDQVLFWDLKSRVTPHFTPILADAGVAAVTLASCWIVAGLFTRAFHMRNTLDCSTERAVLVTGQTWITSSILLIILATSSHHMMGAVNVEDISASVLMVEGRTLSPVEEFFSVLTRADSEYIFNSLGVVLTWRFLISFMMGGWTKK